MTAFLVRSCGDIPIDSNNLVFYLKSKNCGIKSRTRPFFDIEMNVACAIIDVRKEAMELPPATLMDTGYDAGCADVAHIPLILLMDEGTEVPNDWLGCKHVYKSDINGIKEVVDIFVTTVLKFQREFKYAKKGDIGSRRELRQEIIDKVNKSIGKVSGYTKEKRGEL